MADKQGNGEPEEGKNFPKGAVGPDQKPRFMSAEVSADWNNDVVIIQEKSPSGLHLTQPLTFVMPMDAYILTACSLIEQRIARAAAAAKVDLQKPGAGIPLNFRGKGPRRG